MSQTNTPVESTLTRITGVSALLSAIVITGIAVVFGEGIVYMQMSESILGQQLWVVSAALLAVFVGIGAVFAVMVVLGIIEAVETPRLNGKTEYTLIGSGGLIGVTTGALISIGVFSETFSHSTIPSGTGESLLALGMVSIPLAYVFHQLYKPDIDSAKSHHQKSKAVDPEVVRKKTERWTSGEIADSPSMNQHGVSTNTVSASDESTSSSNNASENLSESDADSQNENRNADGGHGDIDFTETEFRWVTETDIGFSDVGGMDSLKSELDRDVIKPLTTHREKAAELGVSAPNIIFHGPPGTGKTFMAKALATELGLPFTQLSGADIQSKWINESSQKVKALFEEATVVAKQEGGAVVFLDELDSVLKNRDGGGSSHEEDNKVVNEFLNHLEDTEEHNIVFIGATNRLESLDEAGIRSGRIDKKIRVGKPDMEARKAVLAAQLDDRPSSVTDDELREVAVETSGVVAADLELVVKTAAKQVLIRDGDYITVEDMRVGVEELT